MKNLIIVVVAVAIVVAGVVIIRPQVQKYSSALSQVEHYIDKAERLQGLLEVNTRELNRIQSEWSGSQKEIQQLTERIEQAQGEISVLSENIQDFNYEIPEISQEVPEDIEECLSELQGSRQINETLIQVVEHYREQTAVRMAVISSQGLVIDSQAEIIQRQADYIDEFEVLLQEHTKRSNRRILIGVAVGFVAALFI